MLPPIDIGYIAEQLVELGDEIQRAFDEAGDDRLPSPEVLLQGLDRLLAVMADDGDVLGSLESLGGTLASTSDALLDHGLQLLSQLAELATGLGLQTHACAVELLSLPLCCWSVRRGGELQRPALVASATTTLVKQLELPEESLELCRLIDEILDGSVIERLQDNDATDPPRPWRTLVLNRAMAATRSRQPDLMETAYAAVAEYLLEDAPAFFHDIAWQLGSFAYPPEAREIIQRYVQDCCASRRLH